jgi:hypothetical protein
MRRHVAIVLMLIFQQHSSAQIVSTSLDILDASDEGGPTPEGVLVIDGFVDIGAPDLWTASGTLWQTYNGTTIIYHDGDAALPGVQPDVLDPGSQNDRFVTVLSRPRGRNADARFDNGGAAISSNYDGGGPGAELSPTALNVAYFANPPVTVGDPSVDGYVIRVALDISVPLAAFGASNADVFLSASRIPDLPLLAAIEGFDDGNQAPGWVNATFIHPTPIGSNAYVYLVPEPGSAVAFVLLAIVARPPRRSLVHPSD